MGSIVEIIDIDYKRGWAEKEDSKEFIFISLSKEEIQTVRKMLSEQKTLNVFLQRNRMEGHIMNVWLFASCIFRIAVFLNTLLLLVQNDEKAQE